jgi:hypothetical protein
MAIAGSLIKGATKVVGKAINVAKKKKKDLDTKGRRVKKKLVNKELDKAEASSKPIEAGDKANKSIKRIINTPDAVVGAGATATQVGKKAVKATKETVSKATNKLGNETASVAVGVAAAGSILAGGGITNSLVKANSKPEQEYTTKRLPDGRFSTTFGGSNANVVFANKQLSEKQINEVRTQLAVLDSIIDSSDPKARSKEFTETVEMLSKKYGISNITGKNLSVLIPMNK